MKYTIEIKQVFGIENVSEADMSRIVSELCAVLDRNKFKLGICSSDRSVKVSHGLPDMSR